MGATTKSNNTKFSPFMPNNKFSTQMQLHNQAIAAAVEDASADIEQDPIVLYMEMMHKLNFLCHQVPRTNLNKDLRLIQIETFYQQLFQKPSSETLKKGILMKVEISKLITGSRDTIFS